MPACPSVRPTPSYCCTKAWLQHEHGVLLLCVQAVTFLGTIGDYIVSGGADGFVRFYDPLLRIVAWFEDLGAGPVIGVSYSLAMPARVRVCQLYFIL